MTRLRLSVLVLGLAAITAGCNTPPPGPGAIAENYVEAVAGGNYGGACAILSQSAQSALGAAMRSSAGCSALLARCLPANPSVLNHDQVQLFYANVDSRISGSRATVATSGTAVADRVKRVTLVRRQGVWHLTSYGQERCTPAHK